MSRFKRTFHAVHGMTEDTLTKFAEIQAALQRAELNPRVRVTRADTLEYIIDTVHETVIGKPVE